MNDDLTLYAFLSRMPFCRTYLGKIMLIAFLGIHVPLIALIVYLVVRSPLSAAHTEHIIGIAVIATLLGASATLYALYAVLSPVSLASRALRTYMIDRKIPAMPTQFGDEAGRLMADVHYALTHIDLQVRTLEKISQTDQLTEIYNRGACEDRLKDDLARSRRSSQSMSLVITDIDQFKPINDQYGHDAGDICILHVVATTRRCLRQGDWIGRWGGDEFIIGLWNAGQQESRVIMERVCAALRESPARLSNGQNVTLTISSGICVDNQKDDARMLFLKADSALIAAKNAGRDQVMVFTDAIPLISSKKPAA